jgi:glutaminyl-tRNA synthetase
VKYVKSLNGGDFVLNDFEKASGVGVSFTSKQLSAEIAAYIEDNKSNIETLRYKTLSSTLAGIKKSTDLKWASPLDVKAELEKQFEALLGPKDERDAPPAKGKGKAESKAKPTAVSKSTVTTTEHDVLDTTPDTMFSAGFLGALHKPGGNAQKYPENMKKHLEATGGQVLTRFPPEPNGFLHIGHSKAITVNFGYARYHGGKTILRFDDTNPEAEEEIYFESIKEIIKWLGFKPYKITYSSDYFNELFDFAEKLILADKAYVCHSTGM